MLGCDCIGIFPRPAQLAAVYGATPSVAANEMATALLGPIDVVLTIIGIVVCPITSGDTALRSSRITIADELNLDQKKLLSRLKIAIPLFAAAFALTFVDFTLVWRYVGWAQLIISSAVLLSATAYLIKKEKQYIITLVPAIICILITFGYILQAPEGLRLPSMIANVISVIATAAVTIIFLKHIYQRNSSTTY